MGPVQGLKRTSSELQDDCYVRVCQERLAERNHVRMLDAAVDDELASEVVEGALDVGGAFGKREQEVVRGLGCACTHEQDCGTPVLCLHACEGRTRSAQGNQLTPRALEMYFTATFSFVARSCSSHAAPSASSNEDNARRRHCIRGRRTETAVPEH